MANVDARITVSVLPNNLKATADYIPNEGEGKALTPEEVVAILSENGVTSGIIMDNIKNMCASTRPLRGVVVAEMIKPGVGENAHIEPFVSIKRRNTAKEQDDGSVDHHDLGEIASVTKGQKLYRRIPPALGKPGADVRGNEIPGLPGKDIRIVLGNGTFIDETDENIVIAGLEGEIILKNGVIHIAEIHEVKEDVDFSTGNISFKGSVKIGGTVRAGFTVEAGSIQINGSVEDATVIGGNDVTILGGFAGNSQGLVKAGRDVILKFVENQKVEAARDIILNGAAYHSRLSAGRSIISKVGKGMIVGGQAEAKFSIEALRFGSAACVPTIIKIGVDPTLAERMKNIDTEIDFTKQTAEKLEQSIVYVYKVKIDRGALPPDKAALLEKLETARKGIPEKIEKLQREREALLHDHTGIEKSFASADVAVYAKVRAYVGNQFISVEDNLGPSIFKMFEGEVVRMSK